MEMDPEDLYRVLNSLVCAELARLRGGRHPALPELAPETSLTGTASGLDSIELLGVAAAVGRMFHLHEPGVEDWLLQDRSLGQWAGRVHQVLASGVAHITFTTSGSTGIPKPCTHAWAALEQEVGYLHTLFDGTRRVVALVPPHHIYGFLFTVLLPRALGVPVLDATGHLIPGRKLSRGDLVVAFPLRWRHMAAAGGALPAGVTGVTSTAPCDPAVIRTLYARGLSRLVEVYGSSETGGIGQRQRPEEPYRLFPYWRRDGEHLCRRLKDRSEAVEVPDRLDWQDERHFRPAGRRDGAVQVAGSNVFPERVAAVLRRHAWVRDCAVRLMDHREGERLEAFVVLKPDAPDPVTADPMLFDWLGERLPVPQRPVRLSFGPELPRNALGKLADW